MFIVLWLAEFLLSESENSKQGKLCSSHNVERVKALLKDINIYLYIDNGANLYIRYIQNVHVLFCTICGMTQMAYGCNDIYMYKT